MWNELDAFIEQSRQRWHVPGVAVAVVKDDAVLLAKGYGTRDVGTQAPVTADTIFAIGSCTKAFTTTALALLVEQGQLHWNDLVTKYLPNFRLHDPYATREVTVLDLLTHRTGALVADDIWYGTSRTPEQILAEIGSRPGVSLRAQFDYNNIMYLAAGQLIPAITGISYDQFVRAHIFEPFGMDRSSLSTTTLNDTANVASPHVRADDSTTVVPWRNIDNVAPAGAINSSVTDMIPWITMHLRRGQHAGVQVVGEDLLQMVHTPQTLVQPRRVWNVFFPDTAFLTYGLGWFVSSYGHHHVLSHGGIIDGMHATVALVVETGLGIVVLTNLDWNGTKDSNMLPHVLVNTILDQEVGLHGRDWNDLFEKVIRPD
jgi:CubicO group peptidase (beta-lactamase class C family)